MAIGVFRNFVLAANLPSTNNTLANVTGLTTTIAAGQTMHYEFYLPFTLAGTASGAKFRVQVPAAPSFFVEYREMYDLTTSPPVFFAASTVTAAADFGATLNHAGNSITRIIGTVKNGATAGNLLLQFAQNVTDASAATLLAGAWMQVWII